MTGSAKVRSLLDAARDDGPDPAARKEIWDQVAVVTKVAAGASVAASAAVTHTTGTGGALSAASAAQPAMAVIGSKLVAVVALVGVAAATLGVVVAVKSGASQGGAPPAAAFAPKSRAARIAAPGLRRTDVVSRRRDPAQIGRASESSVRAAGAAPVSDVATSLSGDLTEEARLVTEARAALVSGDPARALSQVHAAKRMPKRALEPEELVLESRALRALDRADEAAEIELLLKRRFPEHALAR